MIQSPIPWIGGKGKLLWLIHELSPTGYDRFIDVFGGSGTVTLNHPIIPGCMEIYNDFNSDLTNLFFCAKKRTMALLQELGFLPLNSRDDFNVLYKFFRQEEFTEDYLKEELTLTKRYLKPPNAKAIERLLLKRANRGDVVRAADYFKFIRYSYCGGGNAFAGRPCDIRHFFYLIWECARRMASVVVENKDFESLFAQYDRPTAFFYCDPPYFMTEDCYAVEFPKADHQRLHDAALRAQGFVMISYNFCDYICDLYKEFYIFRTSRPNSMSQKAGSEFVEVVITNYDPRKHKSQLSMFNLQLETGARYELIHEPRVALKF